MFIHTVYFWTKADASPSAIDALLTDCRELLSQIPSVRQIWAGPPVPSERSVVDGSYAVGLTVAFDDDAGHEVYQVHPLHDDFKARNAAVWDRVVVYDFNA